jgi:hypothetical protein
MTIQRLFTRLERLEQHAQAQGDGILHVWRLPDESLEEAFDRYAVDPDDFPAVRVHVWPGERVSSRLATPPAPCWVSRTLPAIAELERRLHEGMKQREAGQLCID